MREPASKTLLLTLSYSFLILLIMFGLLMSGRWLLAALAMADARVHLDNWSTYQTVSSVEDWQQAHDSVQRAISLKPNEAAYHQQMALVYEWKGFSAAGTSLSDEEILESRRMAVAAYRKSAQLRPAWPQGWSHLARMKALSFELDSEFNAAMHSAMSLGRNEAGVNRELSYIASLVWPYLSDPQLSNNETLLTQTKQAIIRGLKAPDDPTVNLGYLRSADLLGEICPELELANMHQLVQEACKDG